MPVFGVRERSQAITAAEPRRKANAELSIRAFRIGTRSRSRDAFDLMRIYIGWGRSLGAFHSACLSRGTCSRSAFPSCHRCSHGRNWLASRSRSRVPDLGVPDLIVGLMRLDILTMLCVLEWLRFFIPRLGC